MTSSDRVVGQPIGRLEGPDKVTGRAAYVADLNPPGVLVGRCLRSPLPHARIVRIDATEARRLPSVRAVLTGFDIPPQMVGRAIRDLPVLARDVVRFVGQKVAAVAADTAEAAEQALLLIEVEYEELPGVYDIEQAEAPGAPVLHPDFNQYVGRPADQDAPSNVASHQHYEMGDVDEGFAQADRVFEHTFTTSHQHQAYLEPHASLVDVDQAGHTDVWVNSKMPFQVRKQMADGLDLPESEIRLNPAPIGGDFGGKGSFMDTHIAYHLSQVAGRPVRMVMDYIEEFQGGNPRHPSRITYKTGVKNDGTILARQVTMHFNSGAYAAFKPSPLLTYGGLRAVGPYRVDNIQVDSYMVYSNLVPCGSLRAPGDPQTIFAAESQIDIIARELGIDPFDMRMRNLLLPGDMPASGHHWEDMQGEEILRQACEVGGYWSSKPSGGLAVGRGMAMAERHIGGGESRSQISVESDGSVTLRTAVHDTGTGMYTILRQIVAEELGIEPGEVRLVQWTTDETDFDTGVGGSRVTHVQGTATMMAAAQVKEKMAALASDLYGWNEEAITFTGGQLQANGNSTTFGELASRAGGPIEADAHYQRTPHEVTAFVAQVAEVGVDTETGQVHLLSFTTSHDVGTIINPMAHQGQIDGGFAQALGFSVMEELQHDEGRPTTVSLGDYKIPTSADMPELRTVLVHAEGGPGPYSSKAIGEHSVLTTAPAIANAIQDAIGVRITQLPITAERVYRAMRG